MSLKRRDEPGIPTNLTGNSAGMGRTTLKMEENDLTTFSHFPRIANLTSSSAITERPREFGDFKRVGHLRLNFRLNGYVSRQYLRTVR